MSSLSTKAPVTGDWSRLVSDSLKQHGVWHTYLKPNNAWSDWAALPATNPPSLVRNVSVGYNNDGAEELFGRDSGGTNPDTR